MQSEGKGEEVTEAGGKRGVMGDSKVSGLRNGGVKFASTQIRKATDKIGLWQKMKNSNFGHVLSPWELLGYSTQFLNAGIPQDLVLYPFSPLG